MAGTSFSSDTIDLFLFEEDELDEEEEEAVLRFRELFCFLPERDSLTFYLLICQLISTLAPLNSWPLLNFLSVGVFILRDYSVNGFSGRGPSYELSEGGLCWSWECLST